MLRRFGFRLEVPFLVVCFGLLGVINARTEDWPTRGLLCNTKENSSMTYSCTRNKDNSLSCEFTQTSVRKKAKAEDLDSKLKRAREEFHAGFKSPTENCKEYTELIEILEGRKKPPKEDEHKRMTDLERKDMLKFFRALAQFCESRTEDNLVAIARLDHDKETRTCSVSSINFKQTFRFVSDNLSKDGTWVTQGQAEGPCGIVQLSRFEPERFKDSTIVNWKYIARKAVTNPQGSLLFGMSCKDLDENEYLYGWRSKDYCVGCDYIVFSPF